MDKNTKIYLAGHQGMVGSAIQRQLELSGYENIVTSSHEDMDLTSQAAVASFMSEHRPDYVVLAAAKVGGVYANNEYPASFIYENLMIQTNVIHQAFVAGVKKLLFLGSSCIYPKFSQQPIEESALLTGPLERTNEPYAVAKIAGIKLCESYNRQYNVDYRSVMPTNLYGPKDNFHIRNSHVIPSLLRRFHEAKASNNSASYVKVWGTGQVRREFMHVDDMASACIKVMHISELDYYEKTEPQLSHINVGVGTEVTIQELAETIAEVTGFTGSILFDHSEEEGPPRKLMDNSKLLALGWRPEKELKEGLLSTYQWFVENQKFYRH